jgi:hypothetical protein
VTGLYAFAGDPRPLPAAVVRSSPAVVLLSADSWPLSPGLVPRQTAPSFGKTMTPSRRRLYPQFMRRSAGARARVSAGSASRPHSTLESPMKYRQGSLLDTLQRMDGALGENPELAALVNLPRHRAHPTSAAG